jgi:hypothetical protein
MGEHPSETPQSCGEMSPTLMNNVFDECSKSGTICKLTGLVQGIQPCALPVRCGSGPVRRNTRETAYSAVRNVTVTQVLAALTNAN